MNQYAKLHARFCNATNAGCIDIINYGGAKKRNVVRHEYDHDAFLRLAYKAQKEDEQVRKYTNYTKLIKSYRFAKAP